MEFLATTNRGLEPLAVEEIADLTGAAATKRHPGVVRFEASRTVIPLLNRRARTLHRVLVLVADTRVTALDDVYQAARSIDLQRYLAPRQAFAIRSSRHGDHAFTSPEIAETAGQAVVDASRSAFGQRLPVDLDDPDVTLRAYVRHDRFALAIDATGESLHRRPYRVREHRAPVRPTAAAAMVRLAGSGDGLIDPMCGSGTIPIEAALRRRGISPTRGRSEFAFADLTFVDDSGDQDGGADETADGRRHETVDGPPIEGVDVVPACVECARENATAAGVESSVDFRQGDATAVDLDRSAVVVDLPFDVRTDHDLPRLYADFSRQLRRGDWETLVALTTRPDLLDLDADPSDEYAVRQGRMEAAVLVVRR
ncbi:MAG: class I SAM-dependent RNA methyltransferase [Halobacteriaceae archaeon]